MCIRDSKHPKPVACTGSRPARPEHVPLSALQDSWGSQAGIQPQAKAHRKAHQNVSDAQASTSPTEGSTCLLYTSPSPRD
eukprot:2103632-Alexandrium_andersonii.AAC.1